MKKIFLILLSTVTLGCATSPEAENPQTEQLLISGNGKTIEATMQRTELSGQLLDRLPVELETSELYGYLIYGDTPIDVESVKNSFTRGFKKGDITYCTYGYLIILTDDQPSGQSSRYTKVGEVAAKDLEKLSAFADGGKIRIEKR